MESKWGLFKLCLKGKRGIDPPDDISDFMGKKSQKLARSNHAVAI
jgi:hypothetical protein